MDRALYDVIGKSYDRIGRPPPEASKMHPEHKEALEQGVARASEAALPRQSYVSAVDVFTGMGLLAAAHVEAWRKGRIYDELLAGGLDRKLARQRVADREQAVLAAWRD